MNIKYARKDKQAGVIQIHCFKCLEVIEYPFKNAEEERAAKETIRQARKDKGVICQSCRGRNEKEETP